MSRSALAIAFVLSAAAAPAVAGVYTDDMSRCLVESTSAEEKIKLVRWITVGMLQHPAVSELGKATPEDIEKSNASVGALFMRLLTEVCKEKSAKAIKYEGPAAIQVSFTVLSQVAAAELFSEPKVQAVMAGLEKHVDSKKIEALAEGSK